MLKIISKSLLLWLSILILSASCRQSQTLTPHISSTLPIDPTVTMVATSTSTAGLIPTPTWSPSKPAITLNETSSISFDLYNSILGSEPRIPSQRIAISPDGKILAAVADMASYIQNIDGNIYLWNMENPDQSLKAFQSTISNLGSITFSDGGRFIAAGGCTQKDCLTSKIIVFDWTTGRVAHILESDGAQIIQLKFTPDNLNLVTQDITGKISYWDLTTRKVIHPTLKNAQYAGAHGFAISPLGDIIAIAGLEGIHLLNLPSLTSIEVRTGPKADIGFGPVIAISPDGQLLIASGCGKYDSETCIVREIYVWSTEKSEPERIISLGKIFDYALAFNHNSDIFAFGGIGIKMWNASSDEEISSPYSSQSILVYDIVFSPNGMGFAALTDKGIILGEVAESQSSWRYTTLDRFGIGRKYIITPAGDNLNLRTDPTTDGTIQRKLASGELITIIFGSVSADGYIWWEVMTQDYETGWVVENAEWYEPVP
jgi:WD40 repeat protein